MSADMFDTTGARCAGESTEIFYELTERNERKAKSLCGACPIASRCLTWAVMNKEPFGIWGGKTPQQRGTIRGAILRAPNNKEIIIQAALGSTKIRKKEGPRKKKR
jgi:WhiB family redox-sensing transcriptional regulator